MMTNMVQLAYCVLKLQTSIFCPFHKEIYIRRDKTYYACIRRGSNYFFTATCPLNPTSKLEVASKYLIVCILDELKFEQVA